MWLLAARVNARATPARARRRGRARHSAVSPAARPLAALSRTELASRFAAALAAADGVGGAHCIHELWMRGEFPAQLEAGNGATVGTRGCLDPRMAADAPHRLAAQAYEVARRFPATAPGRSTCTWCCWTTRTGAAGRSVLYVGMSRYAPARRFEQHKAGIHAAGSVLKRGLEPLDGTDTAPAAHRARGGQARIEAALASALGMPASWSKAATEAALLSARDEGALDDVVARARRYAARSRNPAHPATRGCRRASRGCRTP